ncbi:MAG TPA: T9SS type A sorting domain-containing protein [Flavobacteriales bacterium]|nr:T9SS type A sorting domain-containing protein [Flavobacteriales bacterium]HIA11195.1 T9SS type A sorting domain-containing protein [Flavobacteriales bacterium]
MKYLVILVTLLLSSSLKAQTLTWSAEYPVTGGNSFSNVRPRIALTTGNTPIIMWGDDVNSDVYTAKWTGSGFTAPLKIHSDSIDVFTSNWAGPEFEASGDTVFIGLKVLPEADNGVYSVRSTDGGLTFDDTVRIENIGDSLARFPTVTIANGGNPVFAYMKFDSNWMDAQYTVAQSIDGGDTFEQDVEAGLLVTGEACDCCPAAIKTDGQRQVLMFRNNDNNLRENWLVYSDDGGTSFIASAVADTTNWEVFSCPSFGPDFIISGNAIHSTWLSRGTGGVERIYVGTFDINTMQITFQDTISSGTLPVTNFERYSRMAGEADVVGVVYQHTSFGNTDIILASSQTGSAGLVGNIDTVNISTTGNQQSPDIAYADGTFHIVWQDETSGDVMYRNVTVPYTNIEKPTQTTVEVTISPNPFNGFAILKIEGGKLSTYSLDIYDVSGKIIRSYANQRSDQLIINRGELVAGTYFYKVSSSSMEHTANGKLVISE